MKTAAMAAVLVDSSTFSSPEVRRVARAVVDDADPDVSLAGTKDVLLAPYESRQTPLGELFNVEQGLNGLSVHSDRGVWPVSVARYAG